MMNLDFLNVCERLLAAGINGTYQGVLIALLVAVCLRVFKRTNAATRHAVWFYTLLLIVGLIPAHFVFGYLLRPADLGPEETSRTPLASSPAIVASVPEFAPRVPESASVRPDEVASPELFAHSTALSDWPQVTSDVPTAMEKPLADGSGETLLPKLFPELPSDSASYVEEEQSELPIATEITSQEKIRWAALLNPVPWSFSVTPEIPWKFTAGLLGILVSIAAVRMGVLGGRLYFLQRLKSSTLPAPEALARVFRRLCVELEVRRPVRLQLSSVAGSALLLGFFKPMVLLHVNEAEREPEATEQILRHELAHLNRGDDWLNLIQQCTHAALFFHPAVWWIGKQLSLEREIACDDFVLQRGGTRRAYALLLTDLAQRMQRRPLLLAPGASNNKSQLQQRIKMILDTKRNASPYLAKSRLGLITSAAALAAVLAIYSAPRIVLAESEVRASAAPSVTTTISSTPTVAIASTPTATIVSTPTASVELQPALAPVAINTTPGVPTIIAQAGAAPSGPKYKPDGLPSEDIQPRVPPQPVAPVAPRADIVPPRAVIIAGTPGPTPHPRIERQGDGDRRRDGDLEKRLERLERKLDELMENRNKNANRNFFPGQFEWHSQDMKELGEAHRKMELDWKNSNREAAEHQRDEARDMAKRQAEMSADQARQSAKQAEKANKQLAKQRDEMKQKSFGSELEALRHARESLEHQMQKLDQQIEKLEQKQEQQNKEHGGDDAAAENAPDPFLESGSSDLEPA